MDTGAITGEHQRDFKTATPEMSEEDEIKKADSDMAVKKDEELITKLKTQEAEKFPACGSLANCDKKNHGDSVEDLNNAHTFGEDKHPKTQQKSHECMMNHKKFEPKAKNNNNDNNNSQRDGISFNTTNRNNDNDRNNNNDNGRVHRCFGDGC